MGAQTFLSIGAIALFMFTAVQVNRSYVAASAHVVNQQKKIALVNYGQSLADSLYFVSYDSLENKEGIGMYKEDEEEESRFKAMSTDRLRYDIEVAPEAIMIEGVEGKICTIIIKHEQNGKVVRRMEFKVPIPKTSGD